jgi:NAD(P)-dependent dehydrogenase (short-subunit alcohol dehydrogenase family)
MAAYVVSKAALVHLTRVLDLELRPLGIRVNAELAALGARLGATPGAGRARLAAGPGRNVLHIPGTQTRTHLAEDLASADVELDDVTRAELPGTFPQSESQHPRAPRSAGDEMVAERVARRALVIRLSRSGMRITGIRWQPLTVTAANTA